MGKFKGFSSVKLNKPQKSSFDLTHDKRMTAKPGYLTPVLFTECVPSDSFNGSSEMLVRLAPLLAPIYDQIMIYVHFFFVPCRLLWEDWEEFITGGRLGVGIDPTEAPIPPYFDIDDAITNYGGAFAKSSLADYLGVPIFQDISPASGAYFGLNIDAMPFAAYQLIYEEYYRDRNTVDDTWEILASGEQVDYAGLMEIRKRSYLHDYFTSALPFTQRGEEVLLPVDVRVDRVRLAASGNVPAGPYPGDVEFDNLGDITVQPGVNAYLEGSNAASTINDFRSAYALQVWLERNAVGGSRYTESTQAHFGVRPQDSRLQRPEYIGGGRINVKISEVVSTAYSANADADTVPLANLAGHGVSYGNTNRFNYFCTEHGFIIGLASIMNPPSYHQGLPKVFRRRSFLDYPWPSFAKLGEQQVDAAELYASAANLTEDAEGNLPLFGYQSRYADWKYIANSNHGDFHDTMLFWTLTRDFATSPTLGQEFLWLDSTTYDRIFAVPSVDSFWIYCHNKLFVSRPLPYFGTPNTLGFV